MKQKRRATSVSQKYTDLNGNMSVEDILNYKPSDDEDYYGLLSCDESASVSQLNENYQ